MGTSNKRSLRCGFCQDHPHAYGDKYFSSAWWCLTLGSSPRVWGQGTKPFDYVYEQRIIPTRMGTRRQVQEQTQKRWDHPHAYGDKEKGFRRMVYGRGSSPRVWGQVITSQQTASAIRIIPTRMGTSTRKIPSPMMQKDHPHAYGDKQILQILRILQTGSSPRVWGQDGADR